MVLYIKALIVVLGMGGLVALFTRGCFTPMLPAPTQAKLWGVMVAASVLAFLSMQLPIYFLGVAVLCVVAANALQGHFGRVTPLVLLLLLCCVSPPLEWRDLNVGGVPLIDLSVPRVVALCLLVPAALAFSKQAAVQPMRLRSVDAAVFGLIAWEIFLRSSQFTPTHMARLTVTALLDTWLPYYVASRAVQNTRDIRGVLAVVVLAITFIAGVALFERLRFWQLYADLQYLYNYRWTLTWLVLRDGALRVSATMPVALVLAYAIQMALSYWIILRQHKLLHWHTALVAAVLICGMWATVSRGPVLGLAVCVLCMVGGRLFGARRLRVGIYALFLGAVAIKVSGLDDWVYAQFVHALGGSADNSATFDYRRELLNTSIELLKQSPWVGVPNYLYFMEHLRQGEGIVDLVNTYVAVALETGLIGLALFLWQYFAVIHGLLGIDAKASPDEALLGMGLTAALVGAMVTIFTTSYFSVIPYLNITLIGMGVGMISRMKPAVEAPKPALSPGARDPWASRDG